MKTCPQCKSNNEDIANHCTNCGYNFVQEQNNPNAEVQNIPDKYSENELTNTNMQQNIPQNNVNYQQYQNPNQGYNNQQVRPQNQKSKAVGLILNILVVGLGYAYVGKWGEGIVLFVVYLLMWILGFALFFPFIIAIALWIYSLIKTNQMIDNYNNGLPY